MKLILVRHGESEDDVIDAYGGWADFHLTDKGNLQLTETAECISDLNLNIDRIITSPLFRAKESAQIISSKLNVPVEIFEYVKERNTYGLLSGIIKEEAKDKYPWLVEAYEKDEYVDGSEREEDVKRRATKAYELLKDRKEENLVVVTHGNFLKALMPVILNKKLVKKSDGGYILINLTDTNAEVIVQNGIEVQ
jgi:broad specificity phosphatase PhoE